MLNLAGSKIAVPVAIENIAENVNVLTITCKKMKHEQTMHE